MKGHWTWSERESVIPAGCVGMPSWGGEVVKRGDELVRWRKSPAGSPAWTGFLTSRCSASGQGKAG
jgi:hypothetical protein